MEFETTVPDVVDRWVQQAVYGREPLDLLTSSR
jgi:hypothetical protein